MKGFIFKTLLWSFIVPLSIAPLALEGIGLGISALSGLFHKRKKTPQERFYEELQRKYEAAQKGNYPTDFLNELTQTAQEQRDVLNRNLASRNIEGGLRAGALAELSGKQYGAGLSARERYKQNLLDMLDQHIPEPQPDYFQQIIENVGGALENLAYLDVVGNQAPSMPGFADQYDPYGVEKLMQERARRRRSQTYDIGANPDIFSFY